MNYLGEENNPCKTVLAIYMEMTCEKEIQTTQDNLAEMNVSSCCKIH